MPQPDPRSRISSWLGPAVIVLLALQLGMMWIQGSLLHRQHDELLALREDVRILTDTLEQGFGQEEDLEESLVPAQRRPFGSVRLFRTGLIQNPPPSEEEPARKELETAVQSAREAVSQAREVQSKLSIEENIRKAEEKAKMEEAESQWLKWLLLALGVGLAAVVSRAWIRRKG